MSKSRSLYPQGSMKASVGARLELSFSSPLRISSAYLLKSPFVRPNLYLGDKLEYVSVFGSHLPYFLSSSSSKCLKRPSCISTKRKTVSHEIFDLRKWLWAASTAN